MNWFVRVRLRGRILEESGRIPRLFRVGFLIDDRKADLCHRLRFFGLSVSGSFFGKHRHERRSERAWWKSHVVIATSVGRGGGAMGFYGFPVLGLVCVAFRLGLGMAQGLRAFLSAVSRFRKRALLSSGLIAAGYQAWAARLVPP